MLSARKQYCPNSEAPNHLMVVLLQASRSVTYFIQAPGNESAFPSVKGSSYWSVIAMDGSAPGKEGSDGGPSLGSWPSAQEYLQ